MVVKDLSEQIVAIDKQIAYHKDDFLWDCTQEDKEVAKSLDELLENRVFINYKNAKKVVIREMAKNSLFFSKVEQLDNYVQILNLKNKKQSIEEEYRL